ncbi:RNA-binding domain-containing protein [Winogradskyella sp. 3972H.M.0a.05]|uniref:AlbA family DNA-binding domain-containing protein n=1 Tax=Winogradskyella sp. 3972H.M.0a.05 TaxID=2950277 RepID=UPI0033980A98
MYNQQYLEKLISDKKEESLNLEYKSSQSLDRGNQKKMNEISKDVSAFANANGGTLIYGIIEQEHLPERIDPIDRNVVDREWLEQKIQDSIRPKIEGVIIHPIMIDEENSKVVYLIEIPQSTTAHQALDKKYYKRHNFNSIPMHDYEIRDVINRIKTPKIDLLFKILIRSQNMNEGLNIPGVGPKNDMITTDYILKVYAKNIGKVYANYINCVIKIPEVILLDNFEYGDREKNAEFLLDNKVRDFMGIEGNYPYHKEKYGPFRYEPILPTRTLRIDNDLPFLHHYYRDYYDREINWVVYADNSEPLSGKIKIEDIDIEFERL